ncbi:hypothetical protein Hanom_Chr03g00185381 [Helianthus anomalus]
MCPILLCHDIDSFSVAFETKQVTCADVVIAWLMSRIYRSLTLGADKRIHSCGILNPGLST